MSDKIVFFDIDGTLIRFSDKTMPQSTKKALSCLKSNGVKVFIATGRSYPDTLFIKEYFDFDGFICTNGQYCIDKNENLIHQKTISKSSIISIIEYVKKSHECVEFVNNEGRFVLPYSYKKSNNVVLPCSSQSLLSKSILQINIFTNPKEDTVIMKHFKGCTIARWTDSFGDVYPLDGGKDAGIKKVLDFYDINLQSAMAFGDGGNDVSMLRFVPQSVAMGNASLDVKNSASFVTKNIEHDGIFYALDYYGWL